MTKQEADFIGSMNMCDEISNEAYKKIMCNCEVEEQQPSDDCISREEAIKIFGEVHPLDYNKQSYIANIQKLPSATPKTRWIPCSERLPEKDENVLTYHRNESFDYQYVSWIDDYSGKWAGFIGNLSDEVLAWMPLPSPWEGE